MALMCACCAGAVALLVLSVFVLLDYDLHIGTFLLADVSCGRAHERAHTPRMQSLSLTMRTAYACTRYGLFIVDQRGAHRTDARNELVYNVELYAELALLITEFVHHLHMLVCALSRAHFYDDNTDVGKHLPVDGIVGDLHATATDLSTDRCATQTPS
jgi:hypothetical protein